MQLQMGPHLGAEAWAMMVQVIPRGCALPRAGQEVRVLVGEPVQVDDIIFTATVEAWSEDRLYLALTDRIGQALHALKVRQAWICICTACIAVQTFDFS
jgi:hypothetical protein